MPSLDPAGKRAGFLRIGMRKKLFVFSQRRQVYGPRPSLTITHLPGENRTMEQGGQAHWRLPALLTAKQNRVGMSGLPLKATFISTVDRPARFCYLRDILKLVDLPRAFVTAVR